MWAKWHGWREIGLLLALLPGLAAAADPAPGLMWNRTGLPLVFPLQVRTEAGQDYIVTLTDAETGVPALAARIEGGAVFRVLAPPGTYEVVFSEGEGWQDGAARFGAITQRIALPVPLTFEVLDATTKGGYRVDLTTRDDAGGIAPAVTPLNSCRRVGMTAAPRPQAPFDDLEGYGARIPAAGEVIHHPDARFDPERLTGRETPARPTGYAPFLSLPRYEVAGAPC